VFLPPEAGVLARKQMLCAEFGLEGVTPLDLVAEQPAAWAALPEWQVIALRNEAHIRGCVAVIANLTPFRGPSADVGTVFEVGFARALGLKVFGYATVRAPFLDRTLAAVAPVVGEDGTWRDADGLLVEQFGLFDNLMIEGAVAETGGILALDVPDGERWLDVSVFRRCVARAAAMLGAP
jgi:nucleoside 2-deoxyribosyltransferase